MAPSSPRTVYRSAIDRWILGILALSPLTAIAIGIHFWVNGQRGPALTVLASGVIVTLVTLALTWPCRYTLLQDAISIRCGLVVFYQLDYSDIVSVELSSTWRSGPALSLKRVEIKTKNRRVIVSPRDRESFVRDLRERVSASVSLSP